MICDALLFMSFWSQTFLLLEQQMHNSLKGRVIYINGGAKNSPLGRGQIWGLITYNSCLIRAKFITVLERGSWSPPPHPAYKINGWSERGYIVGDVLHIMSDIRSRSNSCSSDCLFTVCICESTCKHGLECAYSHRTVRPCCLSSGVLLLVS